jgi:serine phosphatase RsbU (regulator of sigma subunit)/ligand-binding sensor domain-containing protein
MNFNFNASKYPYFRSSIKLCFKVIWLLLLFELHACSQLFAQKDVPLSSIPTFSGKKSQKLRLTFEQIFLEQGLSQSIVQCISQDRTGFMWFGTEDGLNRYDGYKFTVIRNNPEDPNSLSYNNITAIYEDRSGILWIGTFYGGLNKFDPQTKRFLRYQHDHNEPNSLSNNNINVIIQDKSGNIWIGTDNGLNKLVLPDTNASGSQTETDGPAFIRYQHDPNDLNSLSHNVVRSICQDKSGALWIGTDGGLNQLVQNENEGASARFIRYQNDPKNPNSLSHNEVYAILEDQSGTLWIGTKGGGLNRLDRQTNQFIHYHHVANNPKSLSHNEVYEIFEDRSGLLWIGTNGGGLCILNRENEEFISFQNDPFDPNSISYNEIRAIYEDRSGLIWIGTYGGGVEKVDKEKNKFTLYEHDPRNANSLSHPIVWSIYEDQAGLLWIGTHGGGLDRLDRRHNQWKHYRYDPDNPNSLSSDIVRIVCEDNSGRLWIGTHGGGICAFDRATERFTRYLNDPNDPTSLSRNEIRAIYHDRSGLLWIGTYGGGLDKLVEGDKPDMAATFVHYRNDPNNPHSLSNDFVRCIYEDRSGTFWVGTEGGGLNQFDCESGTFTHFRSDPNNPNSLNNDYIFSIYEDRAGSLWFGTWGGGLNKFDKSTKKFTHYTEKDGLPNDAIYGILEDDEENLWLSTNNGLSKFNIKTETFKNYSVEDGLQSNEFNGGAYYKSHSGEMFFGGIEGFNSFYPDEIKDNPFIPPVIITAVSKLNKEVEFDKPVSEINELRLSYKDYVFSFEFAALDFTAPEKNRYAYKMEGLDQDWIYTHSKKRFATYTTLAPGGYTFRVKGSNNDGVWNEEGAAIKIIITPPIWKTWWFQSLAALLLFGFIYLLLRRRLKNIRLKTELQAAREAQMSIMPQIDPQIEGFEISGICIPANTVGGDFFDYFWLNTERTKFGIAIGDVSGKAMKSAMTAVMTDGMIHAKVETERISIKAMMTSLNRPMYLKTDKNMFTALCLASLDINTKELTFTNAGLIEPLLKSGGAVQYVEATGLKHPLGLIEDVTYAEKKVQLKAGDILIFMTDGVPEAQNRNKINYGEDRLKSLLEEMNTATRSAQEIKEEIISDVKRFSGAAPQHDDMTVIVVKSRV